MWWFTPQESATAEVRIQELLPALPRGCRVPRLWAILKCFPSPQAGSWMGSGADGIRTSTHMESQPVKARTLATKPHHWTQQQNYFQRNTPMSILQQSGGPTTELAFPLSTWLELKHNCGDGALNKYCQILLREAQMAARKSSKLYKVRKMLRGSINPCLVSYVSPRGITLVHPDRSWGAWEQLHYKCSLCIPVELWCLI